MGQNVISTVCSGQDWNIAGHEDTTVESKATWVQKVSVAINMDIAIPNMESR